MNDLLSMIKGNENGNKKTTLPQQMGVHEYDLNEGGEYLSDGVRMTEHLFNNKDDKG